MRDQELCCRIRRFTEKALKVSVEKRVLLQTLGLPQIYSTDHLAEMTSFGFVHVWSYQSALARMGEFSSRYRLKEMSGYLVFDEAHYFLSDAPFNATTFLTLQQLISSFSGMTHIFMTATPEEVSPFIMDVEGFYKEERSRIRLENLFSAKTTESPQISGNVICYNFSRNYSSYKFHFYRDRARIEARMKAAPKDDKWLVFLESKAQSSMLAKTLGNRATHFDASNKKEGSKDWAMILEGNIPKKFLLTTKVLDNGVSFSDPDLHNIVIEAFDRVSLIQMLGRKRRKPNESVNVFIRVPDETLLKRRLASTNELLQLIERYQAQINNLAFFMHNEWQNFHQERRNLFYFHPNGTLILNRLAQIALQQYYQFCSDLLFEMQQRPDDHTIYPAKVLEWLNLPNTPDQIHWLGEEEEALMRTKRIKLLEDRVGHPIEAGEQSVFYTAFIELASEISQPAASFQNDDRSAKSTIGKHISRLKLPYRIEKKDNAWHIMK